MASGPPAHWGVGFTETIHTKAEGSTLPENNKVSTPFVVVVTGAGKGLGYNISLAYARAGVSGIAISSRTQSDLDQLSKDLLKINPQIQILAQVTDTTKPEDVKKLADQVRETFGGRLDVVVANAGIISKYLYDEDPNTGEKTNRRLPVGIIEDDDFQRVIAINVLGTYYTAKYMTPLLLDKTNNRSSVRAFVAVTSLASHVDRSEFIPTAYNVSKLAMNRLIEHMHNDHVKDGVQAFALHPGAVITPQTELHSTKEGDGWATCELSGISSLGTWAY